jgi:U3 small nucleolar RNA-associated protein 18
VVSSVRFHHDGQLLFTAGLDKALRFFQVDGVENPLVQAVVFPDLPVRFADFTDGGKTVMCVGRRKHFYTCDLVTGKMTKIPYVQTRKEKNWERFCVSPNPAVNLVALSGENGYIVLLDGTSKRYIAAMKMNGQVKGLSFNADASLLYSFSNEGWVYVWDMRTRKCKAKWKDEGSVRGTTIGASRVTSNNYVATGSASGQVNLYESSSLWFEGECKQPSSTQGGLNRRVAPQKSLMNMVDPVHELVFNHDAQVMAVRSQSAKDCVKLVHVASRSVFSNWPTQQTPLHYCTSVAFSPASKYLALGNARGKVLLYRLHHY